MGSHVDFSEIDLGMDLEEFRIMKGYTFDELAQFLGITQNRQAWCYAIGATWPKAERLEEIVRKTRGKVTVLAMHQRRLKWLRDNKKIRKACELPMPPGREPSGRRHAAR